MGRPGTVPVVGRGGEEKRGEGREGKGRRGEGREGEGRRGETSHVYIIHKAAEEY